MQTGRLSAPSRHTAESSWRSSGRRLVACFFWLGRKSVRKRAARVAYGMLLLVVSLIAGALGGIFVFFWVATDHLVAHHNENILQCSPLALGLIVSAVMFAFGKARGRRLTKQLTTVIAAGSALGLVLKVLPWFDQGNGAIIALFLPLWVGVAMGARAAAAHDSGAEAGEKTNAEGTAKTSAETADEASAETAEEASAEVSPARVTE